MSVNPIVIAIPVYFLLIGVEIIYQRITEIKTYRLKDALTNINCGVISQITGAFLMTLLFGLYTFVQENMAFFYIPVKWWAFPMAFVLFDFMYYWAHRLSHEINLFWAAHSVHHQSEDYNLTVALRQSSTQILWTFLFYLPLALAGFDPLVFITSQGVNLIYQFWIHTESIKKMPKWFEAIFNTPSHHRVHHARNPKYIDKNHGGTLIIWDRIFKTFAKEEEKPYYGITRPLQSWNPLWANFVSYMGIYHDWKRIPKFKDKLRLLVNKPGWLPDYMGGYSSPKQVPRGYKKFDVKTTHGLNSYVVVQFLIVIASTLLFLFYLKQMQDFSKILVAFLIIASVASFGLLFEKRKWSKILEYLRIIAMPSVLVYICLTSELHLGLGLLVGIGVYSALSVGWFFSIRKQLKPNFHLAES